MQISVWKQFKLIITDPPRYKGHFKLTENKIIPFVDENHLAFWITDYLTFHKNLCTTSHIGNIGFMGNHLGIGMIDRDERLERSEDRAFSE